MQSLGDALWLQHRDPLSFYVRTEQKDLWAIIWPERLTIWVVFASVMAVLFAISSPATRPSMLVLPLLMFCLCVVLVALLVTLIGSLAPINVWLRFWVLYITSAPILCVLLIGAMVPHLERFGTVALSLGLPAVMFFLLNDAVSVAVHLAQRREIHRLQRRNPGGPIAESGTVGWWKWTRRGRFVIACVSVGEAMTLWVADPVSWVAPLFLLSCGCAVIRLEATCLAMLGFPLWGCGQCGQLQLSYCARNATFLIPKRIGDALQQMGNPKQQSAAVVAMYTQSCAGAAMARAVTQLPHERVHPLLLSLSTEAGGALILGQIKTALPPNLRSVTECYIQLAREAAKPLVMQQWLTVLNQHLPDQAPDALGGALVGSYVITATDSRSAANVEELLLTVRGALADYSGSAAVGYATQALFALVLQLAGKTEEDLSLSAFVGTLPSSGESMSWPQALLLHLYNHFHRLQKSDLEG